jgi:predicted phosphodiesterase
MSLIGIISDVHADVEALRAALGHMQRLGCRRIVCAGDMVDYGHFPEATVALMIERKIPCARGNHDRWAVRLGPSFFAGVFSGTAPADEARREAPVAGDAAATEVLEATAAGEAALSDRSLAYLESLPETLRLVEDDLRLLVCHARPDSDMHGIYADEPSTRTITDWLAAEQANVLVVGHTHLPLVRRVGVRKLVVNPGMLLREPLPGFEAPMVFDQSTGTFVRQEPVLGTFGVLDTRKLSFVVRRVSDGEVVGGSR